MAFVPRWVRAVLLEKGGLLIRWVIVILCLISVCAGTLDPSVIYNPNWWLGYRTPYPDADMVVVPNSAYKNQAMHMADHL